MYIELTCIGMVSLEVSLDHSMYYLSMIPLKLNQVSYLSKFRYLYIYKLMYYVLMLRCYIISIL